MTEDRDFKDVVRRRAAKTGESYQGARRQLENQLRNAEAVARIKSIFTTPRGVVVGCVVERGTVPVGATVAVSTNGRPVHEATVAAIRNLRSDLQAAGTGLQCGLLLEPPYRGGITDDAVVAVLSDH